MSKNDRPENAKPMVAWYDPSQLIKTGIEVFVSTLFGRHSDHRLIEAVTDANKDRTFDYTGYHKIPERYEPIFHDKNAGERKEIWVDYVADTGDGWDSTYAVAHSLAARALTVKDNTGKEHKTQRGDVLVMGGDEVYPTANRKEYEDRLIGPYAAALGSTKKDNPHVYAIPGNHDWYDSLASFTRVFVGKEWFGGWYAPQHRSYFALKLPANWWLIAVDTQLGSDLDVAQVEYFEEIKKKMGEKDNVILCCAEPQWIYQKFYSAYDARLYNEGNMAYVASKLLKGQVRVYVAGDLHHYRRHENAETDTHKITCGGGGAFLHPTHSPKAETLIGDELPGQDAVPVEERKRTGDYKKVISYPDEGISKRLTWHNLAFPWLNPWFGGFCSLLYFLLAWAFGLLGPSSCGGFLIQLGNAAIDHSGASVLAMVLVISVALFTDTHNPTYKWVAGLTHGFTHLAGIFLLGWVAAHLQSCTIGPGHPFLGFLLKGATVALGAWFLGSLIMGVYLLFSLNGPFGRHYNEAFSSLAIPDYKCFLRFHIRTDGSLTIYPMGIDRVPRAWKKKEPRVLENGDAAPLWDPQEGSIEVKLIEGPINVKPRT